jgi:hypothetical protein
VIGFLVRMASPRVRIAAKQNAAEREPDDVLN